MSGEEEIMKKESPAKVKRLAKRGSSSGSAGIRQRKLAPSSSSFIEYSSGRHSSRKANVYDDADSQTSDDEVAEPFVPKSEPAPEQVSPTAPPPGDLNDSSILRKLDRSSIIDQSEYEYNPVFKNYQSVFENLMKAIRVDTDWAVINCQISYDSTRAIILSKESD